MNLLSYSVQAETYVTFKQAQCNALRLVGDVNIIWDQEGELVTVKGTYGVSHGHHILGSSNSTLPTLGTTSNSRPTRNSPRVHRNLPFPFLRIPL